MSCAAHSVQSSQRLWASHAYYSHYCRFWKTLVARIWLWDSWDCQPQHQNASQIWSECHTACFQLGNVFWGRQSGAVLHQPKRVMGDVVFIVCLFICPMLTSFCGFIWFFFHNFIMTSFGSDLTNARSQVCFLHVWPPALELLHSMWARWQVCFTHLVHVPHISYLVGIPGIFL